MSASQIELVIVASISIALGYVLLFVDPQRYPEGMRRWPMFSGRWRKVIGWIALIAGAANMIIALAGK